MQIPLRITYRQLERSEAIDAAVREKAAKLERFAEQIIGCHVLIEIPHRHHHQGRLFHVKVNLTLPGGGLVVGRDPQEDHAHEDVYVAIRDAFDAVARRIEDYVRRRRADVKRHEEAPHGEVRALFPERDHGFIETSGGREIYFHRNSVLDGGFDALTVGTAVRFVEEQGDAGPQASSVHPLLRAGAERPVTT
jgi:ribosomal subunit interface protein